MPATISLKTKIKEKCGERAKLVADARVVLDKAEAEKRPLNSEERAASDKMMTAIEDARDCIARMEKLYDSEEEGEDERDAEEEDEDERADDDDSEDEEDDEKKKDADSERSRKDRGKERRGKGRIVPAATGDKPARLERRSNESQGEYRTRVRRSSSEYRAAFCDYLINGNTGIRRGIESRALQADSDIIGGYMVAPQQFVAQLIKFVDNDVWIRKLATKQTVTAAQSLGVPSLDTDIADADWTSELATGNEDTSMLFGKRELFPHPLAKRAKISNRLLRMSAIPVETLLMNRLRYKFGVSEEKGFMTGSGAQQPLGLFTASSNGISTGRDVTAGTSTAPTADGLRTAKYTLKPQYWKSAEWIFHRDGIKLISQLKDGMGQYLWQPGITQNEPDVLLGFKVNLSEYSPNTFTTGLYYGILGAFDNYWIADSETMTIERLVELYAETNQTGFIARQEIDGMPTLEEAFVRLALA